MNKPQFIDIQSLTFDPELQVRVRINDEQVSLYAECMASEEDMKVFPPVEIFYDGVKYWLADGHHRRAAAEKAGHKRIWGIVKSGTHDDALWAAIVANGKQGLPLTREDKKRAVEIAVKKLPGKSLRLLAEKVGSSPQTVMRIKDQLFQMEQLTVPETTVGKDGKSRPAKQKSKKQTAKKESANSESEEPTVESDAEEMPDTTEQPSEQESQFRPGSLPTKKYVGETQLKPIPRDRPDILVANLIAFFPEEFVMNTAFEVFKMMCNRKGKSFIKPFALEIHKAYGRGK
jgi:ParB-like chromosome segregation protein Spo0J